MPPVVSRTIRWQEEAPHGLPAWIAFRPTGGTALLRRAGKTLADRYRRTAARAEPLPNRRCNVHHPSDGPSAPLDGVSATVHRSPDPLPAPSVFSGPRNQPPQKTCQVSSPASRKKSSRLHVPVAHSADVRADAALFAGWRVTAPKAG